MKSKHNVGRGYKLLSRLFDDIVLGRAAQDFGWNVHLIYDTRFDVNSQEKRVHNSVEKVAQYSCRGHDRRDEDFYFSLLPARRFCN